MRLQAMPTSRVPEPMDAPVLRWGRSLGRSQAFADRHGVPGAYGSYEELNAAEARDIRDRAEAAGLFAAEALWSFFLPKFDVARQVLESGTLGELTTVLTEYGEHYDP